MSNVTRGWKKQAIKTELLKGKVLTGLEIRMLVNSNDTRGYIYQLRKEGLPIQDIRIEQGKGKYYKQYWINLSDMQNIVGGITA